MTSKWISVKQKLPELYTPVLVVYEGEERRVRVGERRGEHPGFEDTWTAYSYWTDPYDDCADWEDPQITHWMPLPEMPPPEEVVFEEGEI